MHELHSWQRRLRPLLTPPAAVYGLAMRLRAALYAKGLAPAYRPSAPCVGVGAIAWGVRGRVMVSAWLLGWAQARGITPALVAGPSSGNDAELLAAYRPGVAILSQADPVQACKTALAEHSPDFLVLHDLFSQLNIRRRADLALLDPLDLDRGWNRPYPSGFWREPAQALERASAFMLCLNPEETPSRQKLVQRRLGRFERPAFTVHPRIWRLRAVADNRSATDLGGEPYILVSTESQQEVAAKAATAFLRIPPRFTMLASDGHRFSPHDLAQLGADATRLRCPHILATPETALRLENVPGRTLWTYDPDVVMGPCLLTGQAFTPWWDSQWSQWGTTP